MSRHTARSIGCIVLALVLTSLTSRAAEAQAIAKNFEELRFKVRAGDTVHVTDQSGRETVADIIELTDTRLVVGVSGERRELTEADVRRIRQRLPDSLWTGALIGLAAGGVFGGVAAAASESCSYEGGGTCATPVLVFGGIGLGVGAGVDALIQGRKVIYESAGGQPAVAWRLSPMVGRTARAVRLTVSF